MINLYKYLNNLKNKSLSKILENSSFEDYADYYNCEFLTEPMDCINDIIDDNDKCDLIQKIIFSKQCDAHKLLWDLSIKSKKLKKNEKINLNEYKKWELQIILNYYMLKYNNNLKKEKLIKLIHDFYKDMKKINKKEINLNEIYELNLKQFIHIIGEDTKNIQLDPKYELKIDNDCHNWTADERRLIRCICHQSSYRPRRDALDPDMFNNPLDYPFSLNTAKTFQYEKDEYFFKFLSIMQSAPISNNLRSNTNWRLAFKFRKRSKVDRNGIIHYAFEWISFFI